MRALLPYAQLVRLPNVFTAWADVVLGTVAMLALGTTFAAGHVVAFVCVLASSTLLYWAGMVWNDYFDLDQDRLERPGRPLPSGRVSVRTAFWLGVAFFVGGLGFAAVADVTNGQWISLPIAACLVLAILFYDGALKQTPAGPLAMGACRFFNVLLGLSVAGKFPPAWGVLMALVVGVYIAGVTLFAKTEAKESNAATLTTAAIVVMVSLALALGVPALALAGPDGANPSSLFPYLLVGFGFYLALAMVPAIRQPVPGKVQPAVKRSVLGLVVLDALLASALVGPLGLLLALLLVPGLLLGRWVYST